MLCFMSKAIIKVVFTGLTILVVSSRMKISDPRMNNQETWHLVDECVLSPLHGSVEVTLEDSVSNASQVNSGHSETSSSSSSSSKRRREEKLRQQFFKQNNLPNVLIETIKYVNWSYEKKWLKGNYNDSWNVENEN